MEFFVSDRYLAVVNMSLKGGILEARISVFILKITPWYYLIFVMSVVINEYFASRISRVEENIRCNVL